ncbi:MAG: NDP-sugar synthase [Actinomycetota bacterium]|nr:NDP-sugar synthase [Actinomycetota bacterium]
MPKGIFPILDVPLGGFGLRQLLSVCASVFVNVDAPARGVVEAALAPIASRGPAVVTFVEEFPEPFGAAGTLVALRERITDFVVTWNADTITDLAAKDLLEAHAASGAPATIAVVPVDRGADVSFEGVRATAYINRHERADAGGGRFMGVAVFERTLLETLSGSRPLGLAEAVLEPLVRSGELAIYPHTGYAIDVGTFPRYLEASIDLLEGRGPKPPLAWPGEVVALEAGVAYMGPGVSASHDALGAGAVLLRGSQVRERGFVERAIVWPGAVVPAGTRVTNSVWW